MVYLGAGTSPSAAFWLISTLAHDDGLDDIDFGCGDYTYKRDWIARRSFGPACLLEAGECCTV